MCREKYRKKYTKLFFVPIEKEVTEIDTNGNESVITISYQIKFMHNARFVTTSLLNLVDNLTEEIHKIKCKARDGFLEYESENMKLFS